jgi:hypothetical protein
MNIEVQKAEENGNFVALQRYQELASDGLWAPLRCDYCLVPLMVEWTGWDVVLKCSNETCRNDKYPSAALLAATRKFLKERGFND